jgi:hypothetical protein
MENDIKNDKELYSYFVRRNVRVLFILSKHFVKKILTI